MNTLIWFLQQLTANRTDIIFLKSVSRKHSAKAEVGCVGQSRISANSSVLLTGFGCKLQEFRTDPDIVWAPWNSPELYGESTWNETEAPPALVPINVTRPLSPPKERMCSWIQRRARDWSLRPALPWITSSPVDRNPVKISGFMYLCMIQDFKFFRTKSSFTPGTKFHIGKM